MSRRIALAGMLIVLALGTLFTGCDQLTNPKNDNTAPTVASAISDLSLNVDSTFTKDLSAVFSDKENDALSFTASSSDGNIATASVSGNNLSVQGMAEGTAAIKVATTDGKHDSVTTSFTVTVATNLIEINGDITEDTMWEAKNNYLLKVQCFVKNGATLTIEAGTTIRAISEDPNGNAPALVVTRDSKIIADGTAENPITFTSNLDPSTLPQRGTWGGLILLGNAPVNISGGEGEVEGLVGVPYGGNDPHDNSGVLRYVRIWYGGRSIGQDNEINGISFAGVGDGTVVEHCEVAYNLDDAYEFWGGTVNIKYMSAVFCGDDDYDTDLGYRGKGQFLFGIKGQQAAGRGFEMDNNGDDFSAQPRSHPQFYNVTLIGPGGGSPTGDATDQMIRLREGTSGDFRNILIAYGLAKGVRVTDVPELATANAPVYPTSADSLYFSPTNNIFDVAGDRFDPATLPWTAQNIDPQFMSIGGTREGATGLDPRPQNTDILTGGETLPDDGFFDPNPEFIGAFGNDLWLSDYSILTQQ